MVDATHAASSALDAFSKSLAVTSNNIANMNTDGYKKSRATLQEGQNGGVEVSIEKIDTPGSPIPHEEDPDVQTEESPNADSAEDTANSQETADVQTQETSNVDLAEETVHMIIAQRGYEANLKSIEAQDELQETILDIVG